MLSKDTELLCLVILLSDEYCICIILFLFNIQLLFFQQLTAKQQVGLSVKTKPNKHLISQVF